MTGDTGSRLCLVLRDPCILMCTPQRVCVGFVVLRVINEDLNHLSKSMLLLKLNLIRLVSFDYPLFAIL